MSKEKVTLRQKVWRRNFTFGDGCSRIFEISGQVCSGHDSGDSREEDAEDGEEGGGLFAFLHCVVVRFHVFLQGVHFKEIFQTSFVILYLLSTISCIQ
jgi:hypothetical protein